MIKEEFIDESAETGQKIVAMTDHFMGLMAANIEIQAKTAGNIPRKTGGMQSGIRHTRTGMGQYEVTSDKEYSAAQEAGIIHGSPVENYTTPGTGAHWFQKAIDKTKERESELLRSASNAAGMGVM